VRGIKEHKPKSSAKKKRGSKNPASAILMLSDVHCEERVRPETVNGTNDYSLEVCDRRLEELERRFLFMLDHERDIADVSRIVLWIGGDLITGHIHPDCVEVSQLAPSPAIRWIGERCRGLINRLAKQADEVVVCTNSGNHGRSTEKLRIATELDHSWEQHLYRTLAAEETNKNVLWRVAEGHVGYVDLDGFSLRTVHGHSIKYSGGVYGLALPASKAIHGWDSGRRADLTIFGHYHQWGWLRASRYVSNGSVIGRSAYSVSVIKSDSERPCQGMVVVDHDRNEVTKAYPLFCDADLAKARTA
jgi:hypothetical protein